MPSHSSRAYLIAYDIADPRRLGRVHRCLKRSAMPIQFSVFLTRATPATLARIKTAVAQRINEDEDDVRFYLVPEHPEVVVFGRRQLPEGVLLLASDDAKFFAALTARQEIDSLAQTKGGAMAAADDCASDRAESWETGSQGADIAPKITMSGSTR